MTPQTKVLRMALEALKHTHPSALTSFYTIGDRDKAIKAIEEHLAQPEQEPVAWMYPDALCDKACLYLCTKGFTQFPECAIQPQRKPLSDEEIILIVAECASSHQHTDIHFARAIERAHGIKGLV